MEVGNARAREWESREKNTSELWMQAMSQGVGHLGSLKALVEIEFLETKDGHEASWKDSQPTKK